MVVESLFFDLDGLDCIEQLECNCEKKLSLIVFIFEYFCLERIRKVEFIGRKYMMECVLLLLLQEFVVFEIIYIRRMFYILFFYMFVSKFKFFKRMLVCYNLSYMCKFYWQEKLGNVVFQIFCRKFMEILKYKERF